MSKITVRNRRLQHVNCLLMVGERGVEQEGEGGGSELDRKGVNINLQESGCNSCQYHRQWRQKLVVVVFIFKRLSVRALSTL